MEGNDEKKPFDIGQEEAARASTPSRERMTEAQKAGIDLLWWVGGLIAIVTVVAVGDWIIGGVALPTVNLEATTQEQIDTTRAQIENYEAMREADQQRSRQLFEVIVAGTLLPVFTAILGYVFGTQQAG